jgi:type VI secretion system secreted protein Hcp
MSEIYIEINGIKGESKDAKHRGWIDAISSSYSVTQSASAFIGGGGGVGKADFGNFSFTHFFDRASPVLLKYCAAGKHIPEVTISVCKSGGRQEEYIKITLSECIITSVVPNGSSGSQWTELVAIAYSKITIEYREQNTDGSLSSDGSVNGGWNIKQNIECA